ncbi:unnamed protein product [Toxocara canis]|uniref:ADP-ribosylglycohydrolase n=1 Tax=Toxocara canis TaxID=6265 RepID=A0A183ULQ1_TOXCA|nr:unnamed protein product [Toxocara canis]
MTDAFSRVHADAVVGVLVCDGSGVGVMDAETQTYIHREKRYLRGESGQQEIGPPRADGPSPHRVYERIVGRSVRQQTTLWRE